MAGLHAEVEGIRTTNACCVMLASVLVFFTEKALENKENIKTQ